MTQAYKYFSWQSLSKAPQAPYLSTSPNLLQIHDALIGMGMVSMGRGGFAIRTVRGGTALSTHAFGAALDIRWPNRDLLEQTVLPFLVNYSAELGIQRVHDYAARRYWQAGSGWIGRPPGTGDMQSIHIEVHPDAWKDGRPVSERVDGAKPNPAPPGNQPKLPIKQGSTGNAVKAIQQLVGATIDGKFGPKTKTLVMTWQTAHGLVADGIVGPKTWAAMFPQ